jgi:hypothetical protein
MGCTLDALGCLTTSRNFVSYDLVYGIARSLTLCDSGAIHRFVLSNGHVISEPSCIKIVTPTNNSYGQPNQGDHTILNHVQDRVV